MATIDHVDQTEPIEGEAEIAAGRTTFYESDEAFLTALEASHRANP